MRIVRGAPRDAGGARRAESMITAKGSMHHSAPGKLPAPPLKHTFTGLPRGVGPPHHGRRPSKIVTYVLYLAHITSYLFPEFFCGISMICLNNHPGEKMKARRQELNPVSTPPATKPLKGAPR